MDTKWDLKLLLCLQASGFPLRSVKDSRPSQAKCCRNWTQAGQFQKRSTKWGSIFLGTFTTGASLIPQCFTVSPMHRSQCQFLFSRCKLCLRYTAANFNENLSMQALANNCASTRLISASSSIKGQIFASTFKLVGTIRYSLSWDKQNGRQTLDEDWNSLS